MEGTGEFHVAGSTENGDQALDLVRRLRPQLLVTDVVLPGLDGFGLLRQLNQLGQGAPRTIVVSSFCSRRTVAQAMEMGVYFFLPKPVNEESACVKIGHIIFLLFSNFTIHSNGNQLFLLKGSSSGQLSNCFYDFLSEIIVTPEINLYSSIFIDTDLLYQFPKVFWAVLIQKLNTLGICF